MHTDIANFCVPITSTIRQAVSCIDANRFGIVLIVSELGTLEGTITDGDVRRAMLADVDLSSSVRVVLERKAGTKYARPISTRNTIDPASYLGLLTEHNILHLPVVDESDKVVGLITKEEYFPLGVFPVQAVIMAGGAGTRLAPLTHTTPKPMLHVGNRPLMEIIVGQLRDAGIRRVHVATHHLPEKISDHFGDGQGFGVDMFYVTEDRPLGTAGALGLIDSSQDPILVINGDILTAVDFRSILAFHREQKADLTVAVRQYDIQLPYGVVECDGATVKGLTEKPLLKYFVNAGIYLLEPGVRAYIPNNEHFDMTELIQRLIDAGRPVASFPIREYWLDIGQHTDYERAQEAVDVWKTSS